MDTKKLKRCWQYWHDRCILAERYIELSPCDPDIFIEQLKAYNEWLSFIRNNVFLTINEVYENVGIKMNGGEESKGKI